MALLTRLAASPPPILDKFPGVSPPMSLSPSFALPMIFRLLVPMNVSLRFELLAAEILILGMAATM